MGDLNLEPSDKNLPNFIDRQTESESLLQIFTKNLHGSYNLQLTEITATHSCY